jgi:hypothetical protein
MRRAWSGLGLVLVLAGCWTTRNPLKPPPPPPEYVLPPGDDARFSGPPVYPDKAPADQRKDKGSGDGPPGSLRGPGGGRIGAGGAGGPGGY